tara:strand:- start:566 stop:775 length:210 start_codon:yes stop_codon:yes gene_type:complete
VFSDGIVNEKLKSVITNNAMYFFIISKVCAQKIHLGRLAKLTRLKNYKVVNKAITRLQEITSLKKTNVG